MVIAFCSSLIEQKYFKSSCASIIAEIFLFLCFPIIVGVNSARADYIEYVNTFRNIPVLSFGADFFLKMSDIHTEIGFNIFISIIKIFTKYVTIFFIIFCFISFIFRVQFINFFSKKEDIAIVLFGFLSHEFLRKDAMQIRNGMASAMVLFALIYLYKNRKLVFCILIFIASMFHTVAIIALPLIVIDPFLKKRRLFTMQSILLILIISTFFFKIKDILAIFETIGLLPASVVSYMHWSRYCQPMKIYHPVVLKQITICFFFLFFRQGDLLYKSGKTGFLFKVYFISTLYYLFFLDFEILAGRFGSLFSGVETIFLLQVINDGNFRKEIVMKIGVFLLIFLFFIVNILTFSSNLSFAVTFQ
jgi:hypothetical protein